MKVDIKVLKEGNKLKRVIALEFVEEVYSNDAPCSKRGQYVVAFSDKKGKRSILTQSMIAALEPIFEEIELQRKRRGGLKED